MRDGLVGVTSGANRNGDGDGGSGSPFCHRFSTVDALFSVAIHPTPRLGLESPGGKEQWMVSFSWAAFLVYLAAVTFMTAGGLWGLFQSEHPAFLAPILMGLFFFYLLWEAVVGKEVDPAEKKRR